MLKLMISGNSVSLAFSNILRDVNKNNARDYLFLSISYLALFYVLISYSDNKFGG